MKTGDRNDQKKKLSDTFGRFGLKPGRIIRMGLSSLLVLAATGMQIALSDVAHGKVFLFLYPALFFSAILGGLGAGLLATALSGVLAFMLLLPPLLPFDAVSAGEAVGLAIFLAMGVMFSVFGEVLRSIREREKKQRETIETANLHLLKSNEDLVSKERELAQAVEKLRRLDELKTQFLANVSHELRTPLTLILGPVESFLMRPGKHDATDLLKGVLQNSRALLKHINDLLEIAHLEAGGAQVHYSKCDLPPFIRQAIASFEIPLSEKRISIELETPASLLVQTDTEMLQKILINLIGNAIKFSPEGGVVRCAISGGGGFSADERVAIEISDDGPGVPEQYRREIFERFFQIEESSTRRFGGTGLGLAITKELVELLKGSITAETAHGGGALFRIILPRRAPGGAIIEDNAATRRIDAAHAALMASETRPLRDPRSMPEGDPRAPLLLVIEDNVDMNNYIREILAPEYRMASAYDGEEGLQKILDLKPSLVITDIMMPRINGEDLVKTVRTYRDLDSVPIIVVTAKTETDIRTRLLREGAQDFLTKPFRPDELKARVRNLILARELHDNIRSAHDTELRLRHEIERIVGASTAVSEAIARLPETGLEGALRAIAQQAQTLVGAEYAALGLVASPDGPAQLKFDPWVVVGAGAPDAAKTAGYQLPAGTLGVPIFYRGRMIGNIFLAGKKGSTEFTAEDEKRIKMMAARTGAAIEIARLYENESLRRNWLQNIFDQMPEGIVIVDESGEVLHQNRIATGYASAADGKRDSLRALEFRTPAGEPLPPERYPTVRALRKSETIVSEELALIDPYGQLTPILVSAHPITTPNGGRGAIILFRDIHAIKEVERMREEWNTIIAHDLRQPLSTIDLRAQILLRAPLENLPENAQKAIAGIRDDITRVNRMIQDLLDVSQIDANRLSIRKAPFDLNELVQKVVDDLATIISTRPVVIRRLEGVKVLADADRFQQILGNLLSNAVKYGTPGSEITIDMATSGRFAAVSVVNRGPGIPPDQLPLLFRRFVRTSEARQSTTKGLGLGLYITKGLVEAHGGKIRVESAPDSLTSFCFTIPLAETIEAAPIARAEAHGT